MQFRHFGGFVLGQDLGDDGVDAQLGGDPFRGRLVVTGQHDDFDPCLVHRGHRGSGGLPGGISQGDHPSGRSVHGHQHRGAPGRGQGLALFGHRGDVDALGHHQLAVAHENLPPVHGGPGAVARDVAEIAGSQGRDAAVLGVVHHRGSQRVLRFAFDGRHEAQEFVLADPVGDEVRDLRLALGQGPGLVDHDRVDPCGRFQGGGVLEQHASFGAQPRSHHDRRGGGQAQGIGAGDDHHGDGEQDRLGSAGPGQPPGKEGAGSADQRHEHQPERGPVRQTLPGCLGVLGFLDQCHDLRQGGVRPDLRRPHP